MLSRIDHIVLISLTLQLTKLRYFAGARILRQLTSFHPCTQVALLMIFQIVFLKSAEARDLDVDKRRVILVHLFQCRCSFSSFACCTKLYPPTWTLWRYECIGKTVILIPEYYHASQQLSIECSKVYWKVYKLQIDCPPGKIWFQLFLGKKAVAVPMEPQRGTTDHFVNLTWMSVVISDALSFVLLGT